MSDARFARGSTTHPLGKCGEAVECSMPAQMKADLTAAGCCMNPPITASELLRMLASDYLYGRMSIVRNILSR